LEHVYLFLWIIGALIYFYIPTRVSIFRAMVYLCLTILFLLGLQLTSESRSININIKYFPLNRDILQILFALSFSLTITQLIRLEPKKRFLIALNNLGSKLALFSYTLYLTHFSFIYLFQYLGFPKSTSLNMYSISLFILQIILCLFSSYIIYLLFEKHTDKVKNILKKKLQ